VNGYLREMPKDKSLRAAEETVIASRNPHNKEILGILNWMDGWENVMHRDQKTTRRSSWERTSWPL